MAMWQILFRNFMFMGIGMLSVRPKSGSAMPTIEFKYCLPIKRNKTLKQEIISDLISLDSLVVH